MKLALTYFDVEFIACRSSGAGGQHVNKTNSAVQVRFHVESSKLPEDVKHKILKRLAHKMTNDGYILVRSENERDQKSNKDQAFKLLVDLLQKSLIDPKKRIKTKPTKSSQRRRVDSKKLHSKIKKMRTEKIY